MSDSITSSIGVTPRHAVAARSGAPAVMRAALLACGAAGLLCLSIWIPWLDRDGGRFVLSLEGRILSTLPDVLVLAVVALALAGAAGLVLALWKDTRVIATARWVMSMTRRHPFQAAAVLLAAALGAIDFYELFYDPFQQVLGRRLWMLREDLQTWFTLGATLCAALGLSALWPDNRQPAALAARVRAAFRRGSKWPWAVMIAVPVITGGIMMRFALEGIPHFSDALTYLMQGRMLMAGDLAMPAPAHIDLWQHSLFFVTNSWTDPATGEVIGDGSLFFGKYPIGWPAILGLFDSLRVGFLANGVLVGLLAVLTALTARQFASRRVAVAAGLLLALSPWAWLSAANFASHAASACAVMGFMWQFLRAMRLTDRPQDLSRAASMPSAATAAALAGLFLGAGVLIRPQDSLLFCLPAVAVVLYRMVRDPKRWCLLGPVIAAGALLGVVLYMWINQQTTGLATLSPYQLEDRWSTRDWNPAPAAMFARFFFQAAELSGRMPGWGLGALTIAVLGAIAAGSGWRNARLRLVAASTVLFFLGSTPFGFTNVWWGPRWLLPATPLIAILGAYLLDAVLRQVSRSVPAQPSPSTDASANPLRRSAAVLALCVALAGVLVVGPLRYLGQGYAHTLNPPHAVSAAAADRVREMGLEQVIVAMPTNGLYAPLDARAGIVHMRYPFDRNAVIYIRAVEDWQAKAADIFPGHALYELTPSDEDRQGFTITAVSNQDRREPRAAEHQEGSGS